MTAHTPPMTSAIFLPDGTICDPVTGEIRPLGTIVDHAIYYALNGWHVFPVVQGAKRSHKSAEHSGGRKWGATTDADEIRRNFKKWPNANVGIVTGEESGFFVVETDTAEGHGDGVDGAAALAKLEAEHGALPATREAESPSGSIHRLFKHPGPGFKIKNSASAIGPGIDVRGDGGMVVAPPSIKPGKGVYIWRNELPIADAPQWLLDKIASGKEKPEKKMSEKALAAVQQRDGFDDIADEARRKYIEAALRGEYDEVVRTPEGKRNHQLNDSSLKLGHYVGGGVLDEKRVIDTMMDACAASGLLTGDSREACLATIMSGMEAGKLEPKGIPERKVILFPNGHKRGSSGIALSDFQAYLPMHNYIYIPTRDLWPGVAVDSQLPSVPLFNKDGSPRLKPNGEPVLMTPTTWLDRNQAVAQMTWAPGEPMLVHGRLMAEGGWIDHPGVTCFNLYRPPTITLGDATKAERWVDHVKKVYPDDWDHIITWLAYRVQHPEIKINHCLVLGGKPGAGKDTLLEPVVQAVGPWNVGEASPKTLTGRFNGFLKSVILRVSEARDTGEVNKFQMYETMKTINASPPFTLPVDEKNLREHRIQNVVGAIITSNYKTESLYLPADDRRHYVAWSDRTITDFDSAPDAGDGVDYFNAIWKWYDTEGGFEDIAAYLHALDVSHFNPKAPPLKTPAFWAIVDANRSSEESEIADVLDLIGNPPAITVERLIASAGSDLSEFLRERKNRKAASHKITAAGYEQVRNPTAEDGLWRIDGARKTVYAQTALPVPDRFKAAQQVVAGARWVNDRWVKHS
jgi:Bifunctional DNA primase/polymerase, N-terminal/Family of unknown function (DUF5906)